MARQRDDADTDLGSEKAYTAMVIASSVYLPEVVQRDPLGGYVRYLVLGLAGLALAPWIGRALGLAPEPRRL